LTSVSGDPTILQRNGETAPRGGLAIDRLSRDGKGNSSGLGGPLAALLASAGAAAVRTEEITMLPAGGARRTFRIWLDDGRSLKGRLFRTPELAEVAWRIHREAAPPMLARALARDGAVMLEEWVEGAVLTQGRVGIELFREAGRLLGGLHSIAPPSTSGIRFRALGAAEWARRTDGNLRLLRRAGILTPERARELGGLVRPCVSHAAEIGIVHRDWCPENLVERPDGELVSVDNGSLTIGAIDEDLARVWHRWPMTDGEREVFLDGYRLHREAPAFGRPTVFWAVVVSVNAARVRARLSAAAATAVLRRLDGYLATVETGKLQPSP
jgi:hypothetical protein